MVASIEPIKKSSDYQSVPDSCHASASAHTSLSPDAFEGRLYRFQQYCKAGIFSHETALLLNGLSDREPITVESSEWRWQLTLAF